MAMKRRGGATPPCETPKGCPIEDLATDIRLNIISENFIRAKQLQAATDSPMFIEEFYKSLGTKNTAAAVRLETVWANFLRIERLKKGNK